MQETVAEIKTCSAGNQLQPSNVHTDESTLSGPAGNNEAKNGKARVKMRQKRLGNSEFETRNR
jgi:hypothetical protein